MQTERQHKGAIAEAAVVKRLTELGYTVSVPQSPARYDLIADDGEGLIRIQVKSMEVTDRGYLGARLQSRRGSTRGEGAVTKNYDKKDIDAFALYNHRNDEVYLLSIEDAPATRAVRTRESWNKNKI